MADINYETRAGDMLDEICFNHYGYSSGAVEAVLEYDKNYRLADYPELLPAGVIIYLPQLRAKTSDVPPRIWDDIGA